ncbi:MAG: class I SAM-dependent DNA methyltransferase [Hyphomicrobiales bacterium]|nr:class I SAM-dependent DNA methyltransferase [Hyphomicrobiales bacterium]
MSSGADHSLPELQAFLRRWTDGDGGQERANYALFLSELSDILQVPRPEQASSDVASNAYTFERAVTFREPDGSTSTGRIDLYKRGCFVLEAKQSRRPGGAKAVPEQFSLLPTPEPAPKARGKREAARGWDVLMMGARQQAEDYARALPVSEGWPPFLIVCDIGHCFEIYADFSGQGKNYAQFPDRQGFRIYMEDLANETIRERLRLIWLDPHKLDPAKISARVTREIAARLAKISKHLEEATDAQGHRLHDPEAVALFLMRCLFTMFAEDVELLPKDSFRDLLARCIAKPEMFQRQVTQLWEAMDEGGFSFALERNVKKFNGYLFKNRTAFALPPEEIGELYEAARANWRLVEPAIFGTLLEQALNPAERRKLGAHYTPRAYVERLVIATVMEPLKAQWANVQAAAETRRNEGDVKGARALIAAFQDQLCETKILDPACGTGNFLYVALELMKRLEGEVLEAMASLEVQGAIALKTIDPHQFLGLEVNPRAAAIAELVIWIGFLQWHFRTRGAPPDEPILKDFKAVKVADAVLAWSARELARGDNGRPLERTDAEGGRVEVYAYKNPKRPEWPMADYIVGNPPFIGGKDLRSRLGEGYAQALWAAHPHMNESADFVMYWWDRAAELLTLKGTALKRFGFVTTNSLTQVFQRKVIERYLDKSTPSLRGALATKQPSADGEGEALQASTGLLRYARNDAAPVIARRAGDEASQSVREGGASQAPTGLLRSARNDAAPVIARSAGDEASQSVREAGAAQAPTGLLRSARNDGVKNGGAKGKPTISLQMAIADHPWTKATKDAAAVRIAMTVAALGAHEGRLLEVTREADLDTDEPIVDLRETIGRINSDLTVGADVSQCRPLQANDGLSSRGMMLFGAGFIVTPQEAAHLGLGRRDGLERHIRNYRNGRDLVGVSRGLMVIDLFGLGADDVRKTYPEVYQHIAATVKPERDLNRDKDIKARWWLFGRTRDEIRPALANLPRYIATVETAKHRIFQFLDASILPDNRLVCMALDDGYALGVLSSRIHVVWTLQTGGTLEDRPIYTKSQCFDPFPFPAPSETLKTQIRAAAEELDGLRKQCQVAHPGLTLTQIYNVLEKLRAGQALSEADEAIKTHGLVLIIKELHDKIDALVAQAYGWPATLADEDILARLVQLNAARTLEEQRGLIRWLRPDYQRPRAGIMDAQAAAEAGAQLSVALPMDIKTQKPLFPASDLERTAAVFASLMGASTPLDAATLARSFRQGAKAEPAIESILASLSRLGHAHTSDNKSFRLRRT